MNSFFCEAQELNGITVIETALFKDILFWSIQHFEPDHEIIS